MQEITMNISPDLVAWINVPIRVVTIISLAWIAVHLIQLLITIKKYGKKTKV